jgi:hypothetical protein
MQDNRRTPDGGNLMAYEHDVHPRTVEHLIHHKVKPPKVDDGRVGLNGRIGLFVTAVVGTMWCAYLFTIIALISLPDTITSGDSIIIVAWISQAFLQLVLLPVIIVGQNLQGRAADKRGEQTYKDAEAVLHECLEIQRHLNEQDQKLADIIARRA